MTTGAQIQPKRTNTQSKVYAVSRVTEDVKHDRKKHHIILYFFPVSAMLENVRYQFIATNKFSSGVQQHLNSRYGGLCVATSQTAAEQSMEDCILGQNKHLDNNRRYCTSLSTQAPEICLRF
jgi:hypothetical protein